MYMAFIFITIHQLFYFQLCQGTVSGSAAMVPSTDFARVTEFYQRRCVVKDWTALTTVSS